MRAITELEEFKEAKSLAGRFEKLRIYLNLRRLSYQFEIQMLWSKSGDAFMDDAAATFNILLPIYSLRKSP